MIEMRWLNRQEEVPHEREDGVFYTIEVRTLQYRQTVDKTAYAGLERPDNAARWSWSEWKTVPEAKLK